jgi:hypothetical protein
MEWIKNVIRVYCMHRFSIFSPQCPVVATFTTFLQYEVFNFVTPCIYVFSMSLTKNSNYFSKRMVFITDTDFVLFEIRIQVSFIVRVCISMNLGTHNILTL